jgi:outer membrane protein assembly factor BamB
MANRISTNVRLLIVACACCAPLTARPAAAGDNGWTRFRGPNGSGVSDAAAPVTFAEADFDWKVELPGTGHSSPVMWRDRVYVTTADEDAGRRLLVCVDAADGKVAWEHPFELKPFRKHGDNSYASSTPAVDDEHVYVQWTTQESFTVLAVAHNGTEAWRAELGGYKTQHGGGGSPVVHGGLVIVNLDQDEPGASFVAALDCATGDVRWKTPRASTRFSTSTPCVYTTDAGQEQLVFTTHANGFTALDPATGKVLWELPGVFAQRVVSSPVVGPGVVLGACGEGPGGVLTVAVRPPGASSSPAPAGQAVTAGAKPDGGDGRAAKPEVAYRLTEKVPYVPTPIVYKDRLFTWSDGGTITCHDAATGARVWQEDVKGAFFGSPVCAGGNLYCVSKRGEVVVVRAADKFELLGRNDLGEASHATPAVAGGRLVLRTTSHLISVGGKPQAQAKAQSVGRAAD